jgi:mono/diheme cytochrome c family protein
MLWIDMRWLVLGLILIAASILDGCRAEPPGKVESRLMWNMKHWVLVGNRQQNNPLPKTQQTIADGREAFSSYCAACHGLDGQNTGVPFAERMAPSVPSLASNEVQRYTDGQLKWVIDNGIWPSGMPGSKEMLSEDEIWSIVAFIRQLPRAGSLGEPVMYSH